MRTLALTLLLTVALVAPARASTQESLAILPIVVEGPHGRATGPQIYDAVRRATQRRLGLRLISAEEVFVASREGLTERVADCGTDDGCIASKLRMFDARFGLVVVLSFELEPPVYRLQLLDTDLGRSVGERVGEAGADVLSDLTREADELLLEAGLVERGRVVVEVEPPDAQLVLRGGGAPDRGTPNVFTLEPGRYTIEAQAEGHEAGRLDFEIKSGASQTVTLTLAEETSVWASPWLWIAIGAVVVGGTAAAVVVGQSPERCLCTTIDGRGCGCR